MFIYFFAQAEALKCLIWPFQSLVNQSFFLNSSVIHNVENIQEHQWPLKAPDQINGSAIFWFSIHTLAQIHIIDLLLLRNCVLASFFSSPTTHQIFFFNSLLRMKCTLFWFSFVKELCFSFISSSPVTPQILFFKSLRPMKWTLF